MTPQDIIDRARITLNDLGAIRSDDPELLKWVNDALDAAHTLSPRQFYMVGEITCTAGETIQRVCINGAGEIIDVIRVKGGNAVTKMNKASLDSFMPAWHQATAAAAQHWQRVENDPIRFYLYPPAPANQVLEILYLPSPAEYAIGDTLPLPNAFMPAIHDFVVFRAQSKDDDFGEPEKSTAFLKLFAEALVKGGRA